MGKKRWNERDVIIAHWQCWILDVQRGSIGTTYDILLDPLHRSFRKHNSPSIRPIFRIHDVDSFAIPR